ncbi:MAG: CvpA family protein, partial [Firmicutes bacterium]|nr:CvpA family protein [Bacillota bacterium]
FILSNKRTKETIYYPVAGAEEFSAMGSSEGVVQHLGYKASFPLLLNIEGQPTYLMALKDAGGLVKMYGMVNVEKYHIVATGDTILICQQKYRELLKNSDMSVIETETEHILGVIEDIKTAAIDGTTSYYIKLVSNDSYFVFSVKDNQLIVLKEKGNTIALDVDTMSTGKIRNAILVE